MEPKYGIIGCGNISRFHFGGLAKIKAQIAHVADIDPQRARKYADQFGAKCTTDYQAVLNDPDVTVVSILGPGTIHKTICLEALAAGKDIICEKTLANNSSEAYEITSAVQKSKKLFFTAYMKRFYPAVQKAKELLPALGTLFSAQARTYQAWGDLYSLTDASKHQWIIDSYGGAILKCAGSHILDLLLYFFGRPKSVYGSIDYIANSKVDRKVMALLEYPGSLVVNLEAATHPLKKIGYERNSWDERIEINGINGRLEVSTTLWDHADNNAALLVHYDNGTQVSTEYRFDCVNPFDHEMEYITACLSKREQGRPNAVDGFNVDILIATIEESHQKKACVSPDWKGL
jgi:predicted dehydrogenase